MDREVVIEKLRAALAPLPYINALWLEGSDANGSADEYSDIDFWVDFDDAFEESAIAAAETALAELAEIDYKYVMNHPHPKIRQRVYHLRGTSEFLMIDFCWQLHSRLADGEGVYIDGDEIEAEKVIFDKNGIIAHKEYNAAEFAEMNKARLEEAKYRRTQHCRVLKYVRRGLFPEAFAYYQRYAAEPLIDLLRLIYTPAHADYYLTHISSHIPRGERERLEYFLKASSLEEIERKTAESREYFDELLNLTV